MDETNASNFANKGASYEVAHEIFSLDIQDSAESYPISPAAPSTYSVDKIMTPGLSDKGDNPAASEPTIIQVAPETAQPKSQAKRSWVFTQGYGKRVYDNDVMLIQCQVPGCGRYFKANRGSTSSISYHLLAAHEIPEYPGKPKRTKRKPTQTRKASFKAPQGMFDPKILEFSPLGVRVANLESKLDSPVQVTATKERIPISMIQDPNLLHLLQLSDLDSENVVLLPTDHQTSQYINGIFLECRGQIRELLNKQDSLSLSITHCSGLLPVTVHFLSEDWSAREVLLCMLDPKETATGAEMGKRLMEALDSFQIASKVFTLTTDFSTPMLVLADELFCISTMRKDFKFAPHQHIPCIGHIVNDVVNGVLKSNLDGDSSRMPTGSSEAHHGSILAKLSSVRQGIAAIRETPSKLGHYQNYFNQHQLKYQELVLDTAGNWESTFAMLEGIVANQLAFNSVCATYDMVEHILSPEDITFFEEIKTFLGLFQAFSSRVSSSRHCNALFFANSSVDIPQSVK
ncbi:hypothetical protein DSO57_1039724 [Entomophthora muscae]|uniref:Uncharacterized protein n=1 Tax=Entomophthora muscae TaxID=34485 RepID=A0ACC2RQK2_9FUNG|nr:hypothetical protein DSO57_1039724 [Entomophthora muscae]